MLKKVIIFVIIFIVFVVAWNLISKDKGDTGTLTSSNADTSLLAEDESEVADAFLNTLLNLNTITLSGDIFSDPRFTSLVDYTVELAPQPLGRPNPFIPVGATAPVTTTTTTASIGPSDV